MGKKKEDREWRREEEREGKERGGERGREKRKKTIIPYVYQIFCFVYALSDWVLLIFWFLFIHYGVYNLQVKFLWLEDVYVTGMLAKSAGLNYVNNSQHHLLKYMTYGDSAEMLQKDKNLFLVGHVRSSNQFRYLFPMISKEQ